MSDVKIKIGTEYDPKGVDQAKKDYAGIGGSSRSTADGMLADVASLKTAWVAAGASIAAAGVLIGKAWDQAKQTAEFNEQKGALGGLTKQYGTSADAMIEAIQRAADGTIPKINAITVANKALMMGLDPAQIESFAAGAKQFSGALRADMEGAFAALTQAAATGNERMLKSLGIIVDLDGAHKKYAASLGITVERLTAEERQMVNVTAVQRAMNDTMSKLGPAADSDADKFARLDATVADLKISMGDLFLPAVIEVVKGLNTLAETTNKVINAVFFLNKEFDGAKKIASYRKQLAGFKAELADLADQKARPWATENVGWGGLDIFGISKKDLEWDIFWVKGQIDELEGAIAEEEAKLKSRDQKKGDKKGGGGGRPVDADAAEAERRFNVQLLQDQMRWEREHDEKLARIREEMFEKRIREDEKKQEEEKQRLKTEAENLMAAEKTLIEHRLRQTTLADYQGDSEIVQDYARYQDNINNKLDAFKDYNTQVIQAMITTGAEQHEIEAAYANMGIEYARRKKDFQIQYAADAAGAMSNIMQNLYVATGSKNKAMFETMKVFAIAETIINTYKGAMSAYAALAPIPVVGPALGMAAAAATIVAGMARVQQIRSTSPGTSSSSISAGGNATPTYSGGSSNAYPVPERVEPQTSGGREIKIIVQGNIIDHAAFVREIAPYIDEAKGDKVSFGS